MYVYEKSLVAGLLAFRFVICNCLCFTGSFLFPFFSVLRLWYVAPSHLSRGFLLWAPSIFFYSISALFVSLLLCTMWLNFVSLPGDQPIGRMAFTLLPVLFFFFFFLFLILCNKAPLSTLASYFSCTPSVQHTFQSFHKLCYPTLSVKWGLPLCLQAQRSNVSALLKRLVWPGWLLTVKSIRSIYRFCTETWS